MCALEMEGQVLGTSCDARQTLDDVFEVPNDGGFCCQRGVRVVMNNMR